MPVVRQHTSPRAGAARVITALLESRTGQQLHASRLWRIDSTLTPLLHRRGLPSFDALVAELDGGRDTALADAVVEALLNHETSFFRDPGILDHAVSAAMRAGRGVRIWSAGCATGQEPLSIAMLCAEQGLSAEIRATDVSQYAVQRARSGIYSQFEVQRGLSVRRLVRWFEPMGDDWAARVELIEPIQFRCHNLAADPAPPGGFDLILCRNVLLYFGAEVRRRVLDKLAGALRPGGMLVLGAGETVIGQSDRLVPSQAERGFYEPV